MRKTLSLTFCCFSLLPLAALAASYDCTRASTAAEIAVCDNPDLNRMDEDLAVTYRSLLDRLPSRQAARLREDQRSWLVARDSCGADVRCLKARYQERLARLNEY
ncbi:MAG: lysozyme inhibitor LprI family protein [Candidatus Contendobacter sp.]|nr:lysozyme inhibitor LprI family protein [Candidatus Contendobacter sp.]MDG4558221.1 lysozyme inhibitor LprI family protein [Candidatus Contendobacter sp.]